MSDGSVPELGIIWDEAKGHIEQDNYEKAIEIYRYILLRYSDNDIAVEYANAYLGDAFLTIGQLELAESHIKKAISQNPDNPGYHYILGFTYSKKCEWKESIREFEVAVAKEPINGEYLRGLGWAVSGSGDRMKGLAYLHKAVELAPTNLNILTDLAVAYLSLRNIDKAKEYSEKAVLIDPTNAMAKQLKVDIGHFQEKLKGLDEIIRSRGLNS